MKEVKQEHTFGCSVACAAAVMGVSYQEALAVFSDGQEKALKVGFYCREIVEALGKVGLKYEYKRFNATQHRNLHKSGTIVFLRKSEKYPTGHYLVRHNRLWMDPWINLTKDTTIAKAKAGFRKRLPGKPIYIIFPT